MYKAPSYLKYADKDSSCFKLRRSSIHLKTLESRLSLNVSSTISSQMIAIKRRTSLIYEAIRSDSLVKAPSCKLVSLDKEGKTGLLLE